MKWNGEQWYIDERSLWKRCRQWVIWIGGWEKANGTGWRLHCEYDTSILMSPAPVSVLGHRLTWFGWGWQLKLKRRYYLVWSKSGLFVSHDGTPPSEQADGFFLLRRSRRRRTDRP